MGAEVLVHVDRPLGSRHPKYGNLIYPVNYGYIQEFKAPGGDFLRCISPWD